MGQARLDEITIPEGWQLRNGKRAQRTKGKLRWERDYRVNASPDAAIRELDKQIVAAGWKRRPDGSCLSGSDVPCWSYDKGGLSILASATDGAVCPAGQPVCANVDIWMSRNYEEPI